MLLHRLRPQLRYHQLNTISIILVLAAVSTLFAGCFGGAGQRISSPASPPFAGPTGGVAVKALLTSGMTEDGGLGTVKAVLTRGRHTLEQELTVNTSNMTAAGGFPKVLIGTWELQVMVYSREGDLAYLGDASVVVQEGKTASIELPLRAAPGVLIMHLDISDFDDCDQPVKGRIIIGTGVEPEMVKEFTRGDSPAVTVELNGLTPKTHDLRVELYEKTFHSYNRVYQSHWETVTIRPGQTIEVNWHPSTGCVEIIGYIDAPPPPPTSVTTEEHGDGILIFWTPVEPVENDLAGYRVYIQTDPLTGFQLAAAVPSGQTSYFYVPEPLTHGDAETVWVQISVSSVDQGGNESIRSHPLTVEWPITKI